MKRYITEKYDVVWVAVVALLIMFARRPSAFLIPQFWAEDGKIWYADAYNHGIIFSLITPENGYFQTFSRLVAILSQAFPLKFGPAIFLTAAVAVQIGTALFIISPRMSRIVPDRSWRLVLGLLYLAIPHSWEIHANVTNSQWHLALLACLIVIAEPSASKIGRAFDISVCLLASMSGPFCVLLIPVAAIQFLRQKNSMLAVFSGLFLVGGAIQAWAYLGVGRAVPPQLDAGAVAFFQIVARHLFISPVLGGRGFKFLAVTPVWNDVAAGFAAIVGIAAAAYAFVKGIADLRLLTTFAVLIVCAALASPAVTLDSGQWPYMATNDVAHRYWFIPAMALYTTLIHFASVNVNRQAQVLARVVLIIVLAGATADFRLSAYKDLEFQRYAHEFESSPRGTEFTIPINPDWEMTLIKK